MRTNEIPGNTSQHLHIMILCNQRSPYQFSPVIPVPGITYDPQGVSHSHLSRWHLQQSNLNCIKQTCNGQNWRKTRKTEEQLLFYKSAVRGDNPCFLIPLVSRLSISGCTALQPLKRITVEYLVGEAERLIHRAWERVWKCVGGLV